MVTVKRTPLTPNTDVENEWVQIELGEGKEKTTVLTKRIRLGAVYTLCDCTEIQDQIKNGYRVDNICPHCNNLQVEIDKDLEAKERTKLVNAILKMEHYSLIKVSRVPKIELIKMSNEKLFSHYRNTDESLSHGTAVIDKKAYEIPCIDCGMYASRGEIEVHGTTDMTPDEFGFHKGSMCHQCYEKELKHLEY
jgi:Zn finger protein HypA/HybF involved in hydrogenase expression